MKSGIFLLAALASLPAAARADHTDFVVVSATASPAYTRQKFANGVPKAETYVFYEGKYFGGLTRDRSMAQIGVKEIGQALAPNLAKQNYLPTRNAPAADLLIVVNWGTTVTDETTKKSDLQTQDLLQDSVDALQGKPDPEQGGQVVDAISALTFDLMRNQANAMSAQKFAESNADLLGYTSALQREEKNQWASPDGLNAAAESHLSDLEEERYFVILLAYDYQKILHPGGAPAGPPQLLWSVRMNIRADGNNFVEALPAMSKVAADFFGRQVDDLTSAQTDVGSKAGVEIGPVRVLRVDEKSSK
jgi:hypothetical protein